MPFLPTWGQVSICRKTSLEVEPITPAQSLEPWWPQRVRVCTGLELRGLGEAAGAGLGVSPGLGLSREASTPSPVLCLPGSEGGLSLVSRLHRAWPQHEGRLGHRSLRIRWAQPSGHMGTVPESSARCGLRRCRDGQGERAGRTRPQKLTGR